MKGRPRQKDRGAPVETILRPVRWFTDKPASSGFLLLIVTVVALAWANSPLADTYAALWQIGILTASLIAGIVGLIILREATSSRPDG
jgi:Na+/H+ antiporter NhaA